MASIMKCDPSVVDLLSKQQNLTVETQEISSEIAEIYLDALDPSNFTDDVCTLLWGLLSNYKRENIFLYDVIDIVSLLIQDDDVVRDFVLKELNEIDTSKTSQDSTKQYIVRKCEDVTDENDMARWLFSEEEVCSRRLALATSCASIIT